MIFTLWGVRGTIPSPGPDTIRYGGNTSCVSVELDDRILIIDAGTGIRPLGETLHHGDKDVFILLTHLHFDHLAGFPFFAPLYETERTLYLLNYRQGRHDWSLLSLLDGVHFPLVGHTLPAACCPVADDAMTYLNANGFRISRLAVNHPGGAYGYRIEDGDAAVVFIPDNELDPPEPDPKAYEGLVEFCRGADVLCHDAQYCPDDWPEKQGWGHSLVGDACRLAADAEVGHLVLFHHDPSRTDDDLDQIQADARADLDAHDVACSAAYEGQRFELG